VAAFKICPEDVNEVLEFFLRKRSEESRSLERTQLRTNPDVLEKAGHRFGGHRGLQVAEELTSVETVGVPGFCQKLPGLARIIGMPRWLPIEVDGAFDYAPSDSRKSRSDRLVHGIAVDGVAGG
jgi:hypothetical protein